MSSKINRSKRSDEIAVRRGVKKQNCGGTQFRKMQSRLPFFDCSAFLEEDSEIELLEQSAGELRIPHTIAEWMITRIHGVQLSVFMALLRYSLGFQRAQTGRVKVVFLANWLKMDPSNVSKALRLLSENGFIHRVETEEPTKWTTYEIPILKAYFNETSVFEEKSRKSRSGRVSTRKSSQNLRVESTRRSGKNGSQPRVKSTRNKESTFNKTSIKSLSSAKLPETLAKYLQGIRNKPNRKKETEALKTLGSMHSGDLIAECVEYVFEKGVLNFEGIPQSPKQRVAFPLAYLVNHIDRVIRNLESWKKDKEAREQRQIVQQIEASLNGIPTANAPGPSSNYAMRIAAFNALFSNEIARKEAIQEFISKSYPNVTNEFEMKRITVSNFPLPGLPVINMHSDI